MTAERQNNDINSKGTDGCLAVSVILPAHNEARSIRETVTHYFDEVNGKLLFEMIVAEDGSVDGTGEILNSLKDELPIMLLSDHNRKGYAKGVSDALRTSKSELVFFSDSDGQYYPADFWSLWAKRDEYDMLIGRKVVRREPTYRIVLSKGFHWLVNRLFGLNLNDIDCGFRLIRRDLINSIIDDVKFLEYSFWAEFTIRSCLKGFRVQEVPIRHNSRSYGGTQIYKLSKLPLIILKQVRGLLVLYSHVRRDSNYAREREQVRAAIPA